MSAMHEAERRQSTRDLVEAIRKFDERLTDIELWRVKSVEPVVKVIRRAMWVMGASSLLIAGMGGLVGWIWLQDHYDLRRASETATRNEQRLHERERVDEQHDKLLDRLFDREDRGRPPRH